MAKVYSEFFDVTIDGNMLTRHNNNLDILMQVAEHRQQFTVVKTGDLVFDISYPMDENDHRVFAALIHRSNSENKIGKTMRPDDGPDGGGPDGTPPQGGTPGAANQVHFTETNAVAA